jgi:hypothetical protein
MMKLSEVTEKLTLGQVTTTPVVGMPPKKKSLPLIYLSDTPIQLSRSNSRTSLIKDK